MPANIETNVSLQPHNTLAIAANAAYLANVSSEDELASALSFAHQRQLPVLVLGEGSNTVFAQDYKGLVILNRLIGIKLLSETQSAVRIKVAAGENWHKLVDHCLQQGWFGLENLALIPGLVGAAPMQNIGAYGVEVKDFIVHVTTLDIKTLTKRSLSNADCQFAYRDSVFKNSLAGKRVITSVEFLLSKIANCNLGYPALASRFENSPSARDVFNAVCDIRSSKLPMPADIPNAGSFFKNPVISTEQHQRLINEHPNLVSFAQGDGMKVAAGWLIEQRGWKDKEVAGVRVHAQQALVITNPKQQSGQAVLALAQAIQGDIRQAYNINLEIEPRIY